MQRVLKPGGAVYLATNGVSHLRELYELEQPFIEDELAQHGTIHITKESGMFIGRKASGLL
jgi:hypothetical protein